jgi:hypothetical protein
MKAFIVCEKDEIMDCKNFAKILDEREIALFLMIFT